MARPFKEGLDYYNLDTSRYQDMKIKKLKHSFSTAGVAVYDFILCEIYRDKGCFIPWGDDTAIDVATYFGLSVNLVNEIVTYCCSVDLFSRDVHTSEKILTSKAIQERYMNICVLSKRKKIIIPESIRLIPEETKVNSGGNSINSVISTQRKEKESKINESNISSSNLEGKMEVTTGIVSVLKQFKIELLKAKAKNGGIPAEKIEEELAGFEKYHYDKQTVFNDVDHILNAWGVWCRNYFKRSVKQENIEFNGQKQTVSKAKDNYY